MDLENERYWFVCDGRAVHCSVLVDVLVGGKKQPAGCFCLTDFDIVIHLNDQFYRVHKGMVEQMRIIKYGL